MAKEERLERALYNWLSETEKFENAVCGLIDKEISKRELLKITDNVKRRFRHLEDLIKFY